MGDTWYDAFLRIFVNFTIQRSGLGYAVEPEFQDIVYGEYRKDESLEHAFEDIRRSWSGSVNLEINPSLRKAISNSKNKDQE